MLRITLKSVRGHFLRFLLTAFAVMVGTGFVAGTFVLSGNIRSTLDGLFGAASKGVDVVVRGTDTGTQNQGASSRTALPLTLEDTLAKVPGVKRVVPDLQGSVLIAGKNGTAVRSGGAPGLGFFWDPQGQSFSLVDGRGPTKAGEVAVEERTLDLGKLEVGDRTKAVVGDQVTDVTIVGSVKFASGSTLGATAVLVDEATARQAFAPDGRVPDFQLEAASGTSETQLRDAVTKVLPGGTEAITVTDFNAENKKSLDTALGFVTTFLLVFAGIALFVGAFIIFNTFAMIVAQRTRELALLRAVGARRAQVMRIVLGESVVIGLLGSALGIGFGVLIAAGAKAALRAFVGLDLNSDLPVSTTAVVSSLVVGVVVTVLGAVIPARRAGRVAPMAALRDDFMIAPKGLRVRGGIGLGMVALGVGALLYGVTGGDVRWPFVGFGAAVTVLGALVAAPVTARPVVRVVAAPFSVLGVVGRLARENALRVPRRTATTASALMIGLALISGLGVVAQSTKASVSDLVGTEITSDYVLNAGNGGIGVPQAVAPAVRKLDGVKSVATLEVVGVKVGDTSVFGVSTDPASLADNFAITMQSGALAALDSGQVLVSETTAKDNRWAVGTTITGAVGGLPDQKLTVGGVFKDLQSFQGAGVLIPTALYEKAVPAAQRLTSSMYVKADPGTDVAALRPELVDIVKPYLVVSVEDGEEFKSTAASGVDFILNLLYALLLFSVVIAVLGIVNTLALSVFERTREIGLLRAVGLRRRQLTGMITIEAVTTALFGAILGTVLGVGLGVALQRGLKTQGLETLAIPWGTITTVLVASAVVGVVAAILPTVRAVRLDILKAIATD